MAVSETAKRIRLFLDGIAVNNSLDLILDSPERRLVEHRRACRDLYERALNQFLTAAVFSDTLVFDRAIVNSAKHSADVAIEFMQRVNEASGSATVEAVAVPLPELLLADDAALLRVATYIGRTSAHVLALIRQNHATDARACSRLS
jgi:hypothetical protein